MTESSPGLRLVDTHAHLNDEQFADDRDWVVASAAAAGVDRLVNVAFAERLWPATVDLSAKWPGIAFTLGIHPNNADDWSDETSDRLRRLLASVIACGIGETGLDYFRDHTTRSVQLKAFDDQLEIARESKLPVVIHMRGDVEADIRSLLEPRPDMMCVFHSFDGSPELAGWIINRGWMIGAGGLLSRRSAKSVRSSICSTPLEQIVLETDSPYLAPTGWQHRRNSPESIPVIAGHVANLLERSIEEVAEITTANAVRVFRLRDESNAGQAAIS